MNHETVLSSDRVYRYTLWRSWGDLFQQDDRYVAFCCLNPSTADETQDDPTVRRCIDFTKRWGFTSYCMLNLFAFRATEPEDMKSAKDPIGPDNDRWILDVARGAGIFVAAWGAHGSFLNRCASVLRLLDGVTDVQCLKLTNGGQPGHPLYLKSDLKPIPYNPAKKDLTPPPR